MLEKRVFVSFDEPCFFQCKHCYTYAIKRDHIRTIDEIVNSISQEAFDVIYVSQKTDNFSDPNKGLELCEKLFSRYKKDLFIITRNVFCESEIKRLQMLKENMDSHKANLYIAISLNALDSNNICEDIRRVCTPEKRIEFIKELSLLGFKPILMLRPVFPDTIIPINECLQIIDCCAPYASCIVSSELGINNDILKRLGFNKSDFCYLANQEYLQGAIDCEIDFVDVRKELDIIQKECEKCNCRFFSHSMPALNYVSSI